MSTPEDNRDQESSIRDQGGDADSLRPAEPPPIRNRPERRRQPRFEPLWNNLISYVGLFLGAMAVMLLVTFGLFSVVTPNTNPYVDIVGYLVLPSVLVIGLILVPAGILFKSWRLRRRDPSQRLAFGFPRINLTDPVQRRAAKVVAAGTFIMLPVVGVSSYHGYHYTDSTEFCANACHAVMEPQAVAYQHSAHARVACAECHIGGGASWFVKAKLSGTRQVLAMWGDTFPRPIPPAITELRPARETCERCHWPRKFFGVQLRQIVRFASDEDNTRREINMLIKTGGGDETTGRMEGIHMHMTLAGRVEYVADDDTLQTIPWVKMTDKNGDELIYRSDGRSASDPKPEGPVRTLDCMDCHNRPAHKFRSPDEAVDIFLDVGKIDNTLPFIKRQSLAALAQTYPDVQTAHARLESAITGFYQIEYPEVWQRRKASVNQAVDALQTIYSLNFFPSMKVDWRTYPDNIGHKNSAGCSRCHDNQHINQYGDLIRSECNICHTFLNPIDDEKPGNVIHEGEFIHPFELQGIHQQIRCDQCHTGGASPPPTCAECHTEQAAFRSGILTRFPELELPIDPMDGVVECADCHDPSEPADLERIDMMCMDCHEDEEEQYGGMLASWKKEADSVLPLSEDGLDQGDRMLLRALRKAGPLHNMQATRRLARVLGHGSAELTTETPAIDEPGTD